MHEIECAFRQEQFRRGFPAQALPGPGIEQPGDIVQLFLGKQRQVGPFGQVLAEQSVGVFADAALPGRSRMSEVHIDSGGLRQPFVMAHLPALVVGHRAPHLRLETVEDFGEGLGGHVGLGAVQLDQSNEQGGAFHQRAHLRAVALADDQVAFPVPRDEPHLDLGGA